MYDGVNITGDNKMLKAVLYDEDNDCLMKITGAPDTG
jgi:hypothetical protein